MAGVPEEVTEGTRAIMGALGDAVLVYGGVDAGLMHTAAEAAKRAGAHVVGIIPDVFSDRTDALCDEFLLVNDLAVRKAKMIDAGDIFVVLPGGIGTLDEWISTVSQISVNMKHDPNASKPILVWNHNGVFTATGEQLRGIAESVYGQGRALPASELFDSAEALTERLRCLLL